MECARRIEAVAPFLVGCSIDNTRYLCPAKRSGTHGTGLHGDVERAILQVLTAQLIGSGGECLHFCMCRDVVERLCEVMCPCDDAVVADHYGTYRHLSHVEGLPGLVEGTLHECLVG